MSLKTFCYLPAEAQKRSSKNTAAIVHALETAREAGKRGHFGCVVDIDRGQQSMAPRQQGADVVIESLQAVHVEEN